MVTVYFDSKRKSWRNALLLAVCHSLIFALVVCKQIFNLSAERVIGEGGENIFVSLLSDDQRNGDRRVALVLTPVVLNRTTMKSNGSSATLRQPKVASKSISPYLLLSHLVLALSSFQMGMFFGGVSCDEHAGQDKACEESIHMAPPTVSSGQRVFPDKMKQLVESAALVGRDDFISTVDYGMPWDVTKAGNEYVLMLYNNQKSAPSAHSGASSGPIPVFSAKEATENCNILKVVQVQPKEEKSCVAIVGQWDSYHVQKLARPTEKDNLMYVQRGYKPGKKVPWLPKAEVLVEEGGYGSALKTYLETLPKTLERLKPIVKQAGGLDRTVIVMVCNFGQSELLMNFVCSARARGLPVSKIVLFATDQDTIDLANSLGIHVFAVGSAFGEEMPKDAARMYGDKRFAGMMMAKVYCVHLVNMLGYNLLFQDVDVVWYKNPIPFFQDKHLAGDFDLYFQDDGARTPRYIPYSPNSGFYYVVHNDRTEYLFSTFARMGDLIQQSGSHQSALNAIISEFASARGLRVKVFPRDHEQGRLFPGGFHYHQRKDFMREVVTGKVSPYIFHMSWTRNKDNKVRFLQQMSDWYVKKECINKRTDEISGLGAPGASVGDNCCLSEPLFKCHYSDKPSTKACKSSPPIDKGRKSFWK